MDAPDDIPPERDSVCMGDAECIAGAGFDPWDSILGLGICTLLWDDCVLGIAGAGPDLQAGAEPGGSDTVLD